MKKLLFCVLLTHLFNSQSFAQDQTIVWQQKLGGSGFDAARDVIVNPDGTVIVVGASYSNDGAVTDHHGPAGTSDGWIVKLDSSGNVLWQKSFGGSRDDVLSTIIAAGDSTYLCTGYSLSDDGDAIGNHGGTDLWAIKITRSGRLLWSKCYGGSGKDTASNAVLLQDGSLAIVGTSNSTNGQVLSGLSTRTDYDAWVIKIDNNSGVLTWEKCIDDSRRTANTVFDDDGVAIVETDDARLMVLLRGSRVYNYGYYPYAETTTRRHGKLYSLNASNGAATYLSTLNNADGGEDRHTLVKVNGSYFIAYTKLVSYAAHYYCTSVFSYFIKVDGQGNILSTVPGYANECTRATLEEYINAPVHGLAVLPGEDFKTAGVYTYGGGSGGGAWEPISGTYVFEVQPFFSSVKAFASGDEVVSVGRDGNDFWIVKQQALNRIHANVYIDRNNNGIRDNGEPPFTKAVLKSMQTGQLQVAYAASDGRYTNNLGLGNYQTSLSILRPYYTASTAVTSSSFSTYKNVVNINYPVTIVPGSRDYYVYVTDLDIPRPGFGQQYRIFYRNNGTDTLNNKVLRLVKDPHLQFNSANPPVTSASGDTLRWTISNLQPDSMGYIDLHMTLDPIPLVQLEDTITMTALLDSTGDIFPQDNISVRQQEIRGSYDPNDKAENYGGRMPLQDVLDAKYLNYTIRFQNTGNDTAFTIVVRDTLDDKLDSTSLEMIAASHPYEMSVKNNRFVTWSFRNIKLLDSFNNEPQSHGFITYRIRAKVPQMIGDVISNKASIYFDFNPPIVTNTTGTKITGNLALVSWLGTASVAWENPLNWSGGKVPDINSVVTIPSEVPNFPEINSNAFCYSIKVAPTARILVKTGMKLMVTGRTN